MVQWHTPAENAKDVDVFHKLIFALFGIYLWELTVTWDFELSLISGRRKFRWPLGASEGLDFTFDSSFSAVMGAVFFFLCRYCMLLAFVGLIISFSITEKINCRALTTFNSWTGNMAILCASTSLMLRTVALWERKKAIICVLGVLCLSHWVLLYRGMFIVVSQWDPTSNACSVIQTNPSMLNTTFFFTMGFDLIILVFTAIALHSRHSARTDLWKLLFQDGLVYFIVSFSTNCIPAVLNVLDLNTPMNVIGTIPAATITSIAACRAVMRLLDFNSSGVFIHATSGIPNGYPPGLPHGTTSRLRPPSGRAKRPEVRVVTEQMTRAEFSTCSPYKKDQTQESLSTDIRSSKDVDLLSIQDDKGSMEGSSV